MNHVFDDQALTTVGNDGSMRLWDAPNPDARQLRKEK
jgi:hypothetical protein